VFEFLKRKKCEQCSHLQCKILVKNPKALSTLIEQIKSEVTTGNIISLPPVDKGREREFNTLSTLPPWPDFILNRFYCSNCKTHFKLYADTYHGNSKNGWYCGT